MFDVRIEKLCSNIFDLVSKQQVIDLVKKLHSEESISDRRVVLDCVLYLLQESQNLDYISSFHKARIIQDLIWEKLNTGHWKEVWKGWRTVYALVAIYRILTVCECLLKKNINNENATKVPENNFDVKNDSITTVINSNETVISTKEKPSFRIQTENKRKLSNSEESNISMKEVMEEIVKMADMGLLLGAPVLRNSLETIAQIITEHLSQDSLILENETDLKIAKLLETKEYHIEDVEVKLEEHAQKLKLLERKDDLGIEDFMINYKDPEKPVIISGCMDDWPAMKGPHKWNVPYLVKIAGPRTVPIEIGRNYTSDHWTQQLMTVKEFADKYLKADATEVGYLAQHQLLDQVPSLAQDICIPDFCYTGEEDDVDVNVWIGPQGTVSPLHTDPKHNVLCQVSGSKYIVLYPAESTEYLYPHPTPLLFNTSRIDLQDVDYEKYPNFVKAEGYHLILNPGEMLYIPPGVWHFVKSLDTSFSVSFWWK